MLAFYLINYNKNDIIGFINRRWLNRGQETAALGFVGSQLFVGIESAIYSFADI